MWSAAISGAYNSSRTVASTTCPPGGQVRNHFARSLPKALDPVRNRRGTEARELVLHPGDGQKLVVFWCYVLLLLVLRRGEKQAGLVPQARDQIVNRAIQHRLPRLRRRGPDVRQYDHIVELEYRITRRGRLLFQNVECRSGYASVPERLG